MDARIDLLDGFTLLPDLGRPTTGRDAVPRAVQRLVAFVCLAGRPGRAAVAGQLWGDFPEEQAQASLRSVLWRLRRTVPGIVEASGGALSLAAGVAVDVRDLTGWVQRVHERRGGAERTTLPDAALLGDLLPGWYDDWVLLERERLRQLRMQALEAVAARLAFLDRHCEALEAAYAAVRADPLRESAHRTVVRVHLAQGNLVEALRAYDFFRTLVEDELGVPPTEQMTRLVQDIPRLRRALGTGHPPARGVALRSRAVTSSGAGRRPG